MADFFRRVEKKYIITKEQYEKIQMSIKDKMVEDEHGKSKICNMYFDTGQYDLIRHSITKPIFKEKIRLRSYNIPTLESTVYLEIKRKYEGIVSKRRIGMKLKEFYEYSENFASYNKLEHKNEKKSQVQKELDYYFKYYNLKETMFLSYDRRAYYQKDNDDFRLTFDSNVVARNYDLKLENGNQGDYIFEKDKYIMEIKTLGAIPMWFVKILTELNVSTCGFSKYGEAYTQLILKANKIKEYVV